MTTAATQPVNLQQELGKRRPFDLPEEEAYLGIVMTADRLADGFRLLFAEHGLSSPLYNVLRIVGARSKDGIRSRAISDDMFTREPDVTRLIDRLEQMRLVRRRRSPEDRRVIFVSVTAAGRRKLNDLADPVRDLHRRQLGHVGARRLKQLSALLFEARHGPTE